jgi:hypothetical protein
MPPDPNPKRPPPSAPGPENAIRLKTGMMEYHSPHDGHQTLRFQFNPTEIERSRSIEIVRTPTGNNLEEPHSGPRNQAKRKTTRKPESWDMTLSLRFDASYPSPNPPPASGSGHVKDQVEAARKFFEGLVEPGEFQPSGQRIAQAHETAPPPHLLLHFGRRSWRCVVKSLRIKEEDFTFDLDARRFEATIGLEIHTTVPQNVQGKVGGVS